MLKVVVLISGGGSNLKALLDAAAEPTYPARVVAVGSDTDAAGLDYAREAGIETFVVRPGPAFELLATNRLNGRIMASPVAVDNALYLRTDKALYRVQNQPKG